MPTTYQLRPMRVPDDYEALAALFGLIGEEPSSAEALADEDRGIPTEQNLYPDEDGHLAGYGRERVVAVSQAGELIGYGTAWRAPWSPPGTLASLFCVHPAHRELGVGSAILAHLEAWGRSHRAAVLMSELKDWIPGSVPFAERRGFVIDAHVYESSLDLAAFSEAHFEGAVEQAEAAGIRFLTLAETPDRSAAEQKLYMLYRETLKDNPGHIGDLPGFGEWRDEAIPEDETCPEWVLIAADGDRFVGVTTLFRTEFPGLIYTDYTGVDRNYRGRGIGLALKLLSFRIARAAGAHTMYTDNEASNAPMIAVNTRLGYQPGRGTYRIIKHL